MKHGPYALLDWSLEFPIIAQGEKTDLEERLNELSKEDPDRYEIMPYDVYELAFGFDGDKRFL